MNINESYGRELKHLGWVCGLLVSFISVQVYAQSQPASAESPSTTTSTTLPASLTAEAPDDLPYPMPKSVATALAFTEMEKNVLGDTAMDGTHSVAFDLGLPILLAKVSKIPPVDGNEYNFLENPPVRILRKYPNEFRLRPVRLELQVYTVQKLTPGKNLAASSYWPKDRNVWQLQCVGIESPDPKRNPVIILTTKDPTEQLGEPDSADHTGEVLSYEKTPRKVHFAGIFYRNYRTASRDGQEMNYPVVLAWQMQQKELISTSWGNSTMGILTGVLVIGAFLVWLWVRRNTKGIKIQDLERRREREKANEEFQPSEEEIANMDPALLAAAEAYFKEHPEKQRPQQKRPVRQIGQVGDEPIMEVDPELKAAAEQYKKDQSQHGKRPG